MRIAQLMWIGSAALGMLAALALHFTVSSAPLPPTHPAVINARISEAWQALNHKSDRLPLAARWKLPTTSEEPAPAPIERRPAREIVQLTPTVMAIRTVSRDVCERHHMHKVWINKWKWKCR
jgi:hypothetical protein